MVPVAILCGGKGTRMSESVETVPKPLVEIGGQPILWHVMSLYAAAGMTRFVLLTGHGADRIERFAAELPGGWDITCINTGPETPTGGRVARARGALEAGTFCLTYADGVADLDLGQLLEFHRGHGGAATITVAKPVNPWGVAQIGDDDRIAAFEEKPRLDAWVNGGFMVLEPRALEYIGTDDIFERAPLEGLAADGELYAFRHDGFWDCMDTYKDTQLLNELWEADKAPWRPLVEA